MIDERPVGLCASPNRLVEIAPALLVQAAQEGGESGDLPDLRAQVDYGDQLGMSGKPIVARITTQPPDRRCIGPHLGCAPTAKLLIDHPPRFPNTPAANKMADAPNRTDG
jgi:hypothetical protein